jgi:hypothetical protein
MYEQRVIIWSLEDIILEEEMQTKAHLKRIRRRDNQRMRFRIGNENYTARFLIIRKLLIASRKP